MPHDASRVLLETTTSSFRIASNHEADPDTFVAGLAVRLADNGGLQTEDDSTAALIGISLGRDLSKSDSTTVVRKGDGVPLRQKLYAASGVITISNYTNAQGDTVTIGATVFTGQAGAATPGAATFQAATSLAATATSLAAQITAHAVASLLVTAVADDDEVLITAKTLGLGGNAIAFVWTNVSTSGGSAAPSGGVLAGGSNGVALVGKKVYVNDDGYGCDDGDEDAAPTSGVYDSAVLIGVDKAADTEVYVALVDMPGGL